MQIVLLPPNRLYKDGEEETVQKGKSATKVKKLMPCPYALGRLAAGFAANLGLKPSLQTRLAWCGRGGLIPRGSHPSSFVRELACL